MRLVELRPFLAGATAGRLRRLARRLGVSEGGGLIPALSSYLASAPGVDAACHGLPEAAWRLLHEFLTLPPGTDFSLPVERLKRRPGFAELYTRGVVGVGRDYWGATRLLMARETWRHLRRRLIRREAASLAAAARAAADDVRTGTAVFRRNLATLIAIAAESGLELTRQGEISRNFLLKKLLPYLELSTAAPRSGANRYPPEVETLLDFARFLQLIEAGPERAVAGENAAAFLAAEDEEIGEAMREFGARPGRLIDPALALELLAALPAATAWLSFADLKQRLTCGLLPPALRREAAAEWEALRRRLTEMGAWETGCGGRRLCLVRLGHFLRGSPVAAGAAHRAEKNFIVTPDFKVTAPGTLSLPLRHQLFQFARFRRADVMDQWEITRESIAGAVEQGVTAAAITDFLEAHASVAPPQNVLATIRLWVAGHAGLRYYAGPVLVIEDPAEAARLTHSLLTAETVVERPAANVFLLRREAAEAVLQKLHARRAVATLRPPPATRPPRTLRSVLKEQLNAAEHAPGAPALQVMDLPELDKEGMP